MPHIHTEPGEIDRTVSVYIVHIPSKKVFLRFHDKYDFWLVPGGHIENTQTAPEAALAEVREEVGLEVVLWQGNQSFDAIEEGHQELIPPVAMNVHNVSPEHRHEDHIYFATSETMDIAEPEGQEKSRGYMWLTQDELLAHPEIIPSVKWYASQALEMLCE